jgi:uncharacterized protein
MVHTFTLHGLNLVLDVESGALHVLDEPSFKAVKKLEDGLDRDSVAAELEKECGSQTAFEIMSEINDLVDKGLLFSKSRDVAVKDEGVVKALCLHLAHDCNLRCGYCFAGRGNYGGERQLMTLETALQAVDFLLTASSGRRHCEIDFFGGEPLLNFKVLKDTVAYGRAQAEKQSKILKFTVTTNAVSLTPQVQQYLNDQEISVVLSLDGRKSVHDRMRRFPGGGGSFDTVLANCRSLTESREGDNYYLRGTYTRHNTDFTQDVLAMLDEGFNRISLEPAVLTPGREDALREADLTELCAEYERLAEILWEREASGEKIMFFHFELDLKKGPCARKRAAGCGAGTAYLAVAPDGGIFPCHQFVSEEDFRAGHVTTGLESKTLAPFYDAGMSAKKDCQDCFARYFCGGGCHAAAWMMNNDLLKPYTLGCKLHQKRVECGLYLQARRMLREMGR